MSDLTLAAKMFKDVFRGDQPTLLAVRNKPGLNRISKKDDLEGYISWYPIRVHLHTGASHTFADAQSYETANDLYRLGIQAKDHYAFVVLSAKEMAMSRSNLGSYLRLKAKEVEDNLEYVGQRMERELWKGVHLGSVSAAPTNVSGTTYLVTLDNRADIINIHVGMRIGCYDDNTGAASTLRAETCTAVTKVNHAAGTFEGTFTANPTAWGTNQDWLYVAGDRSGTSILGWTGIGQCNPATAPTGSDSFQAGGLNRSVMPDFLAGWRGAEYATIEETAQQLVVTMQPFVEAVDGTGSEFWCHAKAFQKLQSEAGARLIREQGGTAILGYTKVKIATAKGDIRVNVGPFCPTDTLHLIDWSALSIRHNKPLFHMVNEDGLEMLRASASDRFEIRWRSWSEVLCDKPHRLGRAPITV